MPTAHRLAALTLTAALLLVAGSALAADAAKVSTKDGLGKYLTDGKGMTLYVFKKDSPGKSACAGDCLAKWPAYDGAPSTADGLKASDFGSISREDGKAQTTYKGLPLYYFAADRAVGDTKGEGMKDVWHTAKP